MKNTRLKAEDLQKIKALKQKENKELLKKYIIDQTESKVKDKFSNKELDSENEKRQILDTIENLWEINKADSKILTKPADYEVIFTQEYYQEMFRLNNWDYKGAIAEKPWKAGRYTNEIIYDRFSLEVLPFLRLVNPFIIPGVRKHKHHQYLTTGSRNELKKFISQATELMKKYTYWNEFKIAYCKMYNLPYQLEFRYKES